jgi:tetratricopeptide (TPR) repeat protein
MRLAGPLLFCIWTAAAQQSSVDELWRRAEAAHQRHDFAEAVKNYRLVLEKRPDLTEARIHLAAVLTETGRLDDAISTLKPAADKPGVRRNLALVYYRKNDLPAAIGEFEQLDGAERADVAIVSVLVDCYLRTGTPAKALPLIEAAAKSHPTESRLLYQLGMARIRTGAAKESLDPLEQAGKAGRSAEAYLLAGATALEVSQFQRARADLEKAVKIDPKLPGVWTWTGMARDRVSDEEGAKQAYRAALELDPRDFEANLHLGAILYRERAIADAKPFLQKALNLQPASNLALYAMALVKAAADEIEGSIHDLQSVTKSEPEWLEPHVKLASLYFRRHLEADARREQEVVEKLRNEHRDKAVPLPEVR